VSLERIEITPFAVIAGEILRTRGTGQLTIIRPPMRKVLYWSQGELVLITSAAPEDSLGEFLVRRGDLTPDRAAALAEGDPLDVVSRVHETGILDLSSRQTVLREWITSLFLPLFSLDEGTAAYSEELALDPDRRVFLQSTAALMLEGIRSITNGLVLRRSLGDLKREITMARNSRFAVENIALTENERHIAAALTEPQTVEAFLKKFTSESVVAARVVIGMLALGVYTTVDTREVPQNTAAVADMQRDLELLAAIGSDDQRSLRAVALSRQLASLDHYQLLEVPRAATRSQIASAVDEKKRSYNPDSYPPIVRDAVSAIQRRLDQALNVLTDNTRRVEYDKLLQQPQEGGAGGEAGIQQRLTQRSIAAQNFNRARDLSASGDYYGAIVLLKQAVQFAPDMADAWFLLGSCQERNPKWRRDAVESFQMALSHDPNHIEAMISLGDLYRAEGLASRAQTCYEDVLKISPDNPQVKSRLQQMKKR
jgi:tetratricopeptide (TPR) repeat protein